MVGGFVHTISLGDIATKNVDAPDIFQTCVIERRQIENPDLPTGLAKVGDNMSVTNTGPLM